MSTKRTATQAIMNIVFGTALPAVEHDLHMRATRPNAEEGHQNGHRNGRSFDHSPSTSMPAWSSDEGGRISGTGARTSRGVRISGRHAPRTTARDEGVRISAESGVRISGEGGVRISGSRAERTTANSGVRISGHRGVRISGCSGVRISGCERTNGRGVRISGSADARLAGLR